MSERVRDITLRDRASSAGHLFPLSWRRRGAATSACGTGSGSATGRGSTTRARRATTAAGFVRSVQRGDHVARDVDLVVGVQHVAPVEDRAELIDIDRLEVLGKVGTLIGQHQVKAALLRDLPGGADDLVEQ